MTSFVWFRVNGLCLCKGLRDLKKLGEDLEAGGSASQGNITMDPIVWLCPVLM